MAIVSPADETTGVSSHPNIKIQFSKPVENISAANITLHEESINGKRISIGSIVSCNDNTYIFTPSVPLKSKTKYYVDMYTNITDTSENHLGFTDFNFTTDNFILNANDSKFESKSYNPSCG